MKPRQIIDGDLVVKFLDLSMEAKQEIFESMKSEALKSLDELNKVVEDLNRLH